MSADEEPELEELLRDGDDGGARPDPAYREEQRRTFLAAGSRGEAGVRTPGPMLSEREERALEGLLRDGDPVRPSPGFRAEARRAFMAGAPPGARPVSGRPRSRLRLALVLAAAAAAAFLVSRLPQPPTWRVDLDGDRVRIAGLERGPGDEGLLAAELGAGAPLESGEGTLDLLLDDLVRLRVLPGTRVRLSPVGGAADGGVLEVALDEGEILVETLAGWPGSTLLVETEESRVRVTGTAFGVLRDERGTCTCVAEGEVEVFDLRPGGVLQRVPTGTTYLAFRAPQDGSAPMTKEMPFPGPEAGDVHVELLRGFASALPE